MVEAEFMNACSVFATEEVCVTVCKCVCICLSVCISICTMWNVCTCLKEQMLLPMYGNACYTPWYSPQCEAHVMTLVEHHVIRGNITFHASHVIPWVVNTWNIN